MAVIGDLSTTLSVNSAGLTTGLRGAGKSFSSFGSSITGMIGKLGPLAAGFAGVAGVAGMGAMVKSSFSSIDALAKVSDKLGETTENIAGLRHAAELSGVGAGAMDTAMQRMTRRLAEAAKGGGTAAGAVQALGLNAEELAQAGPAEAFRQITGAMQGVDSQAEKLRLAFKFFDTEGVGLVNTMKGGVEGLDAAMAEARALGLAPSREEAARIEQANDAITRMKSSFTGVANELAISLAPIVSDIAEGVTSFGISARQTFEEWLPAIKATSTALTTGLQVAFAPFAPLLSMIGATGQSVFTGLSDFVLDAALMAEFAFNNIGAIATLTWEQTKLGVVSLWNDLSHFFTVQIPGVANWFLDNWIDIFSTAFDFVATGFINLGQNIRNAMTEIWEFIKSGGTAGLEFTWIPLTEGFVNTVKEMPQIADREIGALEGQLMQSVDRMSGSLTDGLAAHLTSRKNELLGVAGETGEALGGGIGEGLGEMSATKGPGALGGVGALQRGSSEAFSAVLSAMRGDSRDPAAETAKTSKDMLSELKQVKTELRKQSKGTSVELVAGTV